LKLDGRHSSLFNLRWVYAKSFNSSQIPFKFEILVGRNHMRVRILSKVGLAGVLAISFGFLSQVEAAPLAGVSAAAPAVEFSAKAMPMEAIPQNVDYHHHHHHHHHHRT